MQSINLGSMQKVLDDIKMMNEKISMQRHDRAILEEELNDTQFQRSKLEQKVKAVKSKRMTDEVTLEHDLKSELENKKLQLEQLQEQVLSIKQLVQEEQRNSKLTSEKHNG